MSTTFLEKLQQSHQQSAPEVAAAYGRIIELKSKKLYHQLSKAVLELIEQNAQHFKEGDELIKLYDGFFNELETRVNALDMARIVVAVSAQYKESAAAHAFLEEKAKSFEGSAEAHCLIRCVVAHLYVASGDFEKAKKILDEVQAVISNSIGINAIVYSQYYRVLAIYYKNQTRAGDFYRAGLVYLAYTPLESISEETQINLARDLGLAALVSDDVYSFGELTGHLVFEKLAGSSFSWLVDVLKAFNSGDIAAFRQLREKHADHFVRHKSLSENAQLLDEKLATLALMDLVWRTPASGRHLSFESIAKATALPVDSVELLIIKTLSLELIQGEIDQVDQVLIVQGVQPRVLDLDQTAALADRLKAWSKHIEETLEGVQTQSTELFV